MQIIPVSDVPNQEVTVTLAGQACMIRLYSTLTQGMFCDLYVSGTLIIGGVACQNLNRIVRSLYLGFIGDLCWNDTQGADDPSYPGLGARYQFCYLPTSELNGLG